MRDCYETRNFSYLLGLIEEAQSLANRMESSLRDNKEIKDLSERRNDLKDEVDSLEAEKATIEKEYFDLQSKFREKEKENRKMSRRGRGDDS